MFYWKGNRNDGSVSSGVQNSRKAQLRSRGGRRKGGGETAAWAQGSSGAYHTNVSLGSCRRVPGVGRRSLVLRRAVASPVKTKGGFSRAPGKEYPEPKAMP